MEEIDSQKGSGEKNSVVRRFDPKNNDASDREKAREIDVLISTDVLSEGVNLQSGRVVINYDFHWNPVRLIQRVGRVDRIGTEHETIDIFNFLPTARIETELSLKERVGSKIRTIREIIGHDQKILEATEVIDEKRVEDIYDSDEAVFDSEDGGILDTETESERQADAIREDSAELRRIEEMPFGIRSSPGRGKLLIACEADDETVDECGKVVSRRPFRKHYEVDGDRCRRIFPLSFLKQVGASAGSLSAGRATPPPRVRPDGGRGVERVRARGKKFGRGYKTAQAPKVL